MSEVLEIVIDLDRTRLDIGFIHSFLVNEAYWAKDRTLDQTKAAIESSICFGVYAGERQVGFGRVVTDKATFAYVGDVFIIEEFRGRGLGKRLMEAMISHPELQGLRRWILGTRDAHGLYEQFGFSPLCHPERWMERPAPNAY
ncbi:MAG TPA: GNAT family N-acetyltransferase [Pyrinomonadaceae bacterium]|nr:GNAT family N-acetyltransferase [Pyrinomonadaceae bacterium]HMP65062.1 GNAT family N-acetyltransferase [Pyrinomonadaceae bacterium]